MNFFRNQTKKIYSSVKELLYCHATIFVFRYFIVFWSKKKMETETKPKAADSFLFSPHAKRSLRVMKHQLPFLRRFDAIRRENLYVS